MSSLKSRMSESEASASTNLFFTLISMFAVVNVGYLLVRCKLISVEQGHLKAMSLFTGKLAFPALIFKTFATANLGDVNLGVVAACTLAKFMGMIVVAFFGYWGYESHRDRGSRLKSATLFSFFIAATNDIALGMPVLTALYGAELTNLYIAANVLWTTVLFVPGSMLLFEIGKSMTETHQKPPRQTARMMRLARDIALNPVILATVLGILYKQVFGWTLVQSDGALQLPRPFADVMSWITRPFGTLLLLLTGAPLRSTKVTLWPCLLVLVKTIGVALMSYFASTYFVSESSDPQLTQILRDFCFVYGSMPTSSTPLVFAQEYDPVSTENIASATLFGMVVSAPLMYVSSILVEDANLMPINRLQEVFFHIDLASIFCGLVFIFILIITYKRWGWNDPAKFLLAAYGIVTTLYASLSFVHNPWLNEKPCDMFSSNFRTSLAVGLRWSQMTSALLIVSLLVLHVTLRRPLREPWKARLLGFIATLLSSVFAWVPAEFLAYPCLVSELCAPDDAVYLPTTIRSVAWSMCLLGASVLLVAVGVARRAEVTAQEASHAQSGSSSETVWRQMTPRGVVRAVIGMQISRFFVSAVNTALKFVDTPILSASFQFMLIIGAILDQGQPIIFLFMLIHDGSFIGHFTRILPKSLPCCFGKNCANENNTWFAVVQAPRTNSPESSVHDTESDSTCCSSIEVMEDGT